MVHSEVHVSLYFMRVDALGSLLQTLALPLAGGSWEPQRSANLSSTFLLLPPPPTPPCCTCQGVHN